MPNFVYTNAVVIVHGKSELLFVKYIYTNLHLNVKIYSKNRGRNSIQINGLTGILKKKPFASLSTMVEEFAIEYDKKEKKLKNFKLFIIMDTDDCEEKTKEKYISGQLFQGLVLEEYIVPIYNQKNFEDVMERAKIITKPLSDKKGKSYEKIFPINRDELSIDTIDQVKIFKEKMEGVKNTNLLEFV